MRRKIKSVVLRVLKNDPLAREDDNHLICAVCHEMGLELLPEHVRLIEALPRFSSIVRTRAKIQQQGRFLPPSNVMRERRPYRRRGHD